MKQRWWSPITNEFFSCMNVSILFSNAERKCCRCYTRCQGNCSKTTKFVQANWNQFSDCNLKRFRQME